MMEIFISVFTKIKNLKNQKNSRHANQPETKISVKK